MADDPDYNLELNRFCGASDPAARAAFDRLAPSARRFIRACLTDRHTADDADELTQTALANAWSNRRRFRNLGRAAWYGWLRRIARNASADLVRSADDAVPIPDDWDAADLSLIARLMDQLAGRELFELADDAWMGTDPDTAAGQRNRFLLAVQLHYFEGWSMEEALAQISEARPFEPPVTRRQIDLWLERPPNLRLAAYTDLLYPPERLTALLLGLEQCADSQELDALLASLRSGAVTETGRWSGKEAEAILWRYYRNLSPEEAARLLADTETEDLSALCVRCASLFPFASRCRAVCAWLERVDARNFGLEKLIGAETGVWRRLAFEYRYRYSLAIIDIHERVHPAAAVLRYNISTDVLGVWLSGGRLLAKLRHAYQERHGGGVHD